MTSKWLRVVPLIVALAVLGAACGGDDGDETSDPGQGSETPADTAAADQEFCDAYVEAQQAVIAASAGGEAGDIESLLQAAEEVAPDVVASDLTTVLTTVREASENEDDSAFESEEFTTADEAIDSFLAENCDYESHAISAVDYAFEGVPSSLEAGKVTFDWTNDGEEVHEMLILRFKSDETQLEDLLEMSDRQAQKKIDFIGASFGPPGTQDIETLDLAAGRYAMVCFIPVGATDLDALEKAQGPPHVTKGMSAEFTVE